MDIKFTFKLTLRTFIVPVDGTIEIPNGRTVDVKAGDNISCAQDRLYVNGVYVS
jgi:hypothetical protein